MLSEAGLDARIQAMADAHHGPGTMIEVHCKRDEDHFGDPIVWVRFVAKEDAMPFPRRHRGRPARFRRLRPVSRALSAVHRRSTNTAWAPKRFQKPQGRRMPTRWPAASSATACSTVAPISSTRATKSRMVQKWMLGVSYQE